MNDLSLLMVGDLVLDEPDPDRFFDDARAVLRGADLVVGHVETPYTLRGKEQSGDVPAEAADPAKLASLARAGFHAASLAGNHVYDQGEEGVADTIAGLYAHGIAPFGAGVDLAGARLPAILERGGLRVGFLGYNCVGPRLSWAGPDKGGCAYVQVISHYEPEGANPGGPPQAFTFPVPATLDAMQADIVALRRQVDIVVVSLHKGLVHTPAQLAMYERPVARAAIEAGADIVVGHHPHIARGIEFYKGRPIFHGLGNFVTVTRALNVEGNDHPARLAWAERRRKLFGFVPDPDMPCYPFHPESRNTMIADCRIAPDGRVSAGFRPCWIGDDGAPRVLGNDAQGRAVAGYLADIGRAAGMDTVSRWEGERVVVAPGGKDPMGAMA
ncbi:CapA family protein [Massilia orientalis]|jgi:poly-gamma-glutamate synthesis protein (capsule biosynthesis protein)|uniref:CapA family protein n=1 Tax=Massilia orientalis TaxID=3050128 RepID=A0ACC7M3R8_9BURK|nr:CapA family protein [Massilia sp. YIM B02787]